MKETRWTRQQEPEEEVKLDAVTVLEAIVDIQEEVMNNSLTLESLKNKEE